MVELGEIILGLFLGYLSISITESLSHDKLLHASNRMVRSWRRFGPIGAYLYASWYSHHVVHHFKTFKTNHVTMFSSYEEEQRLKKYLIDNGREQVVRDGYGLKVGSIYRKIQYIYTHILQLVLVCYIGGIWSVIGVLIVIAFYVWVAEYIHPYIHLPYSDALRLSSGLMKRFVKSNYFRYLASHHFIHHKYVNCNFNLVLGGDYLLGRHRSPRKEDIIEMKGMGLLVNDRNIRYSLPNKAINSDD